jgi:signal transduction histidine kinase
MQLRQVHHLQGAAIPNQEDLNTTREDVGTIDNALVFVNDLLRDMLDMHRASNNQLVVKLTPTDVLHDILEPVDGILYQREGHMKVYVECPKNLVVLTDRLRLKQVLLNLGRNSAKFVDDGFLKLRAEINRCSCWWKIPVQEFHQKSETSSSTSIKRVWICLAKERCVFFSGEAYFQTRLCLPKRDLI